MCFRVLALFAVLLISPAAQAVQKVDLDPVQISRAESGERIQVLVWINPGRLNADSAFTAQDLDGSSPELLERAVQTVLGRALGYPAAQMSQPASGQNRPSLLYTGRYTPVAAMSLTGTEIALLAMDPAVVRVESDALHSPQLPSSTMLTGASVVHAEGTTGEGVSIAILDTGVDHQHAAFSGSIIESACFSAVTQGVAQSFCPGGVAADVTSDQAGDNCEEIDTPGAPGAPGCAHGTHVAGIALGRSFPYPDIPAGEIFGMAPGAGLVAVQVFSRFEGTEYCGYSGACPLSYTSNQLAALEWLYDNRERLQLAAVNMSLGGGRESFYCPTHPLAQIIRRLREADISTVISSGNDGFDAAVNAPGCIGEAITVGATRRDNPVAGFSNNGVAVDIYAPGVDILSARATHLDDGSSGAIENSGTSMAAPHVAGAVALLRSRFPEMSQEALEYSIFSTADRLSTPHLRHEGSRFLRVDRAVEFLNDNPNAWVGGMVEIAPLSGFLATAQLLNPQSFPHRTYTLTNRGNQPAVWAIESSQPWIQFSLATEDEVLHATLSGMLAVGESLEILVSVRPDGHIGVGQHLGEFRLVSDTDLQPVRFSVFATIQDRIPLNDAFENAIRTTGFERGGGHGSTQYATVEDGEPHHGGRQEHRSLWWRWTATATASVAVEAGGPGSGDEATIVSVYQGNTIDSLEQVASGAANNGSSGPIGATSVPLDVVEGEEYYISLSSLENVFGPVGFVFRSFPEAPNSHYSRPLTLPGNSGSMYVYNAMGSVQDFDQNPEGQILKNNAWFSWTPTESGTGRVSFPGGSEMYLQAYRVPVGNQYPERIAYSSTNSDEPFGLEFPVEAGNTYLVSHGYVSSGYRAYSDISWGVGSDEIMRLRYAILPAVRSATPGEAITFLLSVVNPASSNSVARNCRIFPNLYPSVTFDYWHTDPSTNAVVGEVNPVFDVQIGGIETFALAETFYLGHGSSTVWPRILCDGAVARRTAGFNEAEVVLSEFPRPDIIAIGATLSGDGIVSANPGATTAFSIAAINLGVAGEITVSPYFWDSERSGHEGSGLELEVCETDISTGQCITDRMEDLMVAMDQYETRTFTIFVRDLGYSPIPFRPSGLRVLANFLMDGGLVGATSVAYRTLQ